MKKVYVQKISIMSGQTEETILERLLDVCEKQRQKELMTSDSPYSNLLQSNAAMIQAISPSSRPETTPLLRPVTLESPSETEEPAKPEPSEAQRKASEQIQATAKNFLQELLTKLKPIIHNAKFCHQAARRSRAEQEKALGIATVEVPTSSVTMPTVSKSKRTKTRNKPNKPQTLTLPLIRSKDGRIILPSSMKPAPQTYYTLTLGPNSEQRPTIFLKPLEQGSAPAQDGETPAVLVQQPTSLDPQQPRPAPPQPYIFKSPLANIGYLNKTVSNQTLPTSPPSATTTTTKTKLTPFHQPRTYPTPANRPKEFPIPPKLFHKPQTIASSPVKRRRGRPRKHPFPDDARTPNSKLEIKEDPDYSPTNLQTTPSATNKRAAAGISSPQPAKRGRGRPPKSRRGLMLSPRVELERCPYLEVKKEEEEWDIDISSVHVNGSRPLTRGLLGKDFPSAKKRSWIDLESELDVDIE
ncbi:hypothetical protein NQD34_018088 [Periophthalmus magnuspinnatus]|nr:hypothetical protein NQD34_018088 [Periophthalmus magnuspinnatus]